MNSNHKLLRVLAVLLVLAASSILDAVPARADKFITVDFPGATATSVHGINNEGQIVGDYTEDQITAHGFVWSKGRFRAFDDPGACARQSARSAHGAGPEQRQR